jgi:hypothetical protein
MKAREELSYIFDQPEYAIAQVRFLFFFYIFFIFIYFLYLYLIFILTLMCSVAGLTGAGGDGLSGRPAGPGGAGRGRRPAPLLPQAGHHPLPADRRPGTLLAHSDPPT